VHLTDVMPMILDEIALPHPPKIQGTSFRRSDRRYPIVTYTGRLPSLAQSYPRFYDRTHYAVYRDSWKLIQRSDGEVELYNLGTDPGELTDRALGYVH
jgi:arylsulfatase A-like enzyme